MLVLSREENQRIVVGNGDVIITVVRIGRDKVKLGIEAKSDTSIHREEVFNKIYQADTVSCKYCGCLPSEPELKPSVGWSVSCTIGCAMSSGDVRVFKGATKKMLLTLGILATDERVKIYRNEVSERYFNKDADKCEQ